MSHATLHERMLRQLTPEQGLAVEVLRQALWDARHPPYTTRGDVVGSWQWRENAAFADARAWFLEGQEEVDMWLELLNLPLGVVTTLIEAAGLKE